MKLGELLKSYRSEHKLSMDAFCELSDLTKGYISMLEKNEHPKSKKPIVPSYETIEKIAKGMQISAEDLIDMLDDDQEIQINATPPVLSKSEIQQIYDQLHQPRQEKVLTFADKQLKEQKSENSSIAEPLTEYHVFEKLSAGNGYDYMEDRNYDVVFYNKDIDHDFASWVYGDSMEPKFLDGSVALIKDTGWDYDGAIYAVDWDGQSYIKKVYKEKDGLRLVSINDKYDDKFAKWEEEPRIIGKVVGNFMPVER
ncbi:MULTISPECIES: XRE family transcriptional regulator [Streptococcus anginosus group]|uniref:LexA repressor n=1 Tax=Streptococcus constellatus TaxID=76860 RepID=A0A564TDP0_STRCV|nr:MULTISPECIES: LexA family transcriptional regulator [Streptococcus anginosus group]VTY23880.1 LexA repressor [Streptococcus anginosus]VUX01153.1 LexA repressor [Streptococcus gordonii]VUX05543.1 LexA repressor [Streptococcus constellatus]